MTVDAVVAPARKPDVRSPRTRLERFLDEGSFVPITPDDGSGVLAGTGRVDGSPVAVFASDATVQGGAMGTVGCRHIVAAYDVAMRDRTPIVGFWHSGGARLRDGVESLDAIGRVFTAMTVASGKVPQLSVVLGPAAGGAAYGPALTDIVVLAPNGRVFVTGPEVVRSVTGEDVDMARLGGPEVHGRRSGVVHVVADTEDAAYEKTRQLTVLLAAQGAFSAEPGAEFDLGSVLPDNPKRAYDVHPIIDGLLDGPGVELHAKWAPNITTTLGRMDGRTVGVIANNPMRLGGCLDSASAEKAARFVRMCDAFGVPLAVVVDVPGYLPGVGQEWEGVVRRGAKLLHAFAEAVVPRVTLVTRKSYGGAYIAMNSKALGATAVYALPDAEVAVMGAVAAVRILHRKRLAEVPEEQRPEVEAELAEEHDVISGGLGRAVSLGVIDKIVTAAEARGAIVAALASAPETRRAARQHPALGSNLGTILLATCHYLYMTRGSGPREQVTMTHDQFPVCSTSRTRSRPPPPTTARSCESPPRRSPPPSATPPSSGSSTRRAWSARRPSTTTTPRPAASWPRSSMPSGTSPHRAACSSWPCSPTAPVLFPRASFGELGERIDAPYRPYYQEFGLSSLLMVPLRARGRAVGILGVCRDEGQAAVRRRRRALRPAGRGPDRARPGQRPAAHRVERRGAPPARGRAAAASTWSPPTCSPAWATGTCSWRTCGAGWPPASAPRCCCSTSTASRTSTTRSATRSATGCSSRWASG